MIPSVYGEVFPLHLIAPGFTPKLRPAFTYIFQLLVPPAGSKDSSSRTSTFTLSAFGFPLLVSPTQSLSVSHVPILSSTVTCSKTLSSISALSCVVFIYNICFSETTSLYRTILSETIKEVMSDDNNHVVAVPTALFEEHQKDAAMHRDGIHVPELNSDLTHVTTTQLEIDLDCVGGSVVSDVAAHITTSETTIPGTSLKLITRPATDNGPHDQGFCFAAAKPANNSIVFKAANNGTVIAEGQGMTPGLALR